MRAIAADVAACSACVSVFYHSRDACKDGQTDRDTAWDQTPVGPRNHALDGGPDPQEEGAVLGDVFRHIVKYTEYIRREVDIRNLIDTPAYSMRAGSMKRSSVCPSVSPSYRSTAAAARGGFAAERLVGRRYRSITARQAPALSSGGASSRRSAANAGSVMMTWRRTLDTRVVAAAMRPSTVNTAATYLYFLRLVYNLRGRSTCVKRSVPSAVCTHLRHTAGDACMHG